MNYDIHCILSLQILFVDVIHAMTLEIRLQFVAIMEHFFTEFCNEAEGRYGHYRDTDTIGVQTLQGVQTLHAIDTMEY